jgi:hypothetical protein
MNSEQMKEPARAGNAPAAMADDEIDLLVTKHAPPIHPDFLKDDDHIGLVRAVIAARDAQWQAARVGGVPEGFDVQHHMAIGAGLVFPMFVVRDTFTQVSVDVFQDESPVVYALLKAWLTAAPQAPADARMVAAPVESYPTQDQAFYAFWYSHMKGELMQPPLAGISHSTARYIWDAAMSAKAGEKA